MSIEDETAAALSVALGFRRPTWGEAMSAEITTEYGVLLWKMVEGGRLRSVHAAHWAAAGFQFYVWEHVTNEHEALRAEVMVLNAIFPSGVQFTATAEGVVVHTADDPGTKLPLPVTAQINQRLGFDLTYLRQIRGLEPLPAGLFMERMRLEADGVREPLPVPMPTAADFASAAELLAEAEREVDS